MQLLLVCRPVWDSNGILHSSQYQNYRRIDLIVIHCSATRATQRYTVDDCRRGHRARGFADIGYHYYITRDGVVHAGRPLYTVGAHATGYNSHSIGICYEGILDIRGLPCDTRTLEQKDILSKLIQRLLEDYPQAKVVGHRDLPGVTKDCPCFAVLPSLLSESQPKHQSGTSQAEGEGEPNACQPPIEDEAEQIAGRE